MNDRVESIVSATSPAGAPCRANFNSLLMYGWTADPAGNLLIVNRYLRQRINQHAELSLCDAADTIDRMDAGETVSVAELLEHLVDSRAEPNVPEIVTRVFARLHELVAKFNAGDRIPFQETYAENEYEIRYSFRPSAAEPPVIGARLMRVGGTLLRPSRNADRVDISIAAVVERNEAGFVVHGFEAAMNEAWSRIESALARGTQAGAIALMSRNLAHNIGSHALYWLSRDFEREEEDDDTIVFHDEEEAATRRQDQLEREAVRRFYQYLQIRMELLAGFATRMPLSTSNYVFADLVESFRSNTMLLERLCKSEGVASISVQYHGPTVVAVSVPGGQLGVHAFYALLENCIRDSAKYAPRRSDELVMHIHAEIQDGTVRVAVHDEAQNFEEHSEPLLKGLEQLRIADDSGVLVQGEWGLKERFICAALLRGVRLETIPLLVGADPYTSAFAEYEPDGRHRILDISSHDGNLAWVFHFLRAGKRILILHGAGEIPKPAADIDVISLSRLNDVIDRATSVRARYVVGYGLGTEEARELTELRPKLPDRVFMEPPESLEGEPLDGLALQREWVRQLVRRHGRTRTRAEVEAIDVLPPIVIADARTFVESIVQTERLPRKDDQAWIWMSDPEVLLVDETFLTDWLEIRAAEDAIPAIVFKRHRYEPRWDKRLKAQIEALRSPVGYLEIFSEGARAGILVGIEPLKQRSETDRAFTAWRLLEAALTRVLIIDERIDMTIDHVERRRLKLCGIDVAGHEYAERQSEPTDDLLRAWVDHDSYDVVVVHRGVLDKLHAHRDMEPEQVISRLEKTVPRVVVHSGRVDMNNLPARTKFLSLSNLSAWIDRAYSKVEIIDELAALRRI